VTEASGTGMRQRVPIIVSQYPPQLPKVARYLYALFMNYRVIKREFSVNNVVALEFSRPELVLFALPFKQGKTFTFQGTGWPKKSIFNYLFHYSSCLIVP
jgi:hypothetical protein